MLGINVNISELLTVVYVSGSAAVFMWKYVCYPARYSELKTFVLSVCFI